MEDSIYLNLDLTRLINDYKKHVLLGAYIYIYKYGVLWLYLIGHKWKFEDPKNFMSVHEIKIKELCRNNGKRKLFLKI
jgi:hypothetical protein